MTSDAKADEAPGDRVGPIVGLSIGGTGAAFLIGIDFCVNPLTGLVYVSGLILGFAIGMFTTQLIARRMG